MSGCAPMRLHVEGDRSPRMVELRAPAEMLVGRDPAAGLRLPHDAVSRRHARLACSGGQWVAEDLGSRHGTVLDGVLLAPGKPVPFTHGSTIAIRPFVLRCEVPTAAPPSSRLSAADDPGSIIRTVAAEELNQLNARRLTLLMQAAEQIHQARDERGVAAAAAEALLAGTGFARALVLRGYGDYETLETLAVTVSADQTAAPSARVSRTLVRAAAAGQIVCLEDQASLQEAQSIVGSGVAAALCAPVVVPPAVEAFLYLDSQKRSARPSADAAAFCGAVARLCGLALAGIRRFTAEERQRELERELGAARRAQRRIMPTERGDDAGVRWRLFSQPGHMVAGDIAGMLRRPSGLVLFAGDVRGKGVDAAIVMASVASHLAACLREGMPLGDAVARTNEYVHMHRRDESDFASLLVVEVDSVNRRLRTVDAGHGLAAVVRAGRAEMLTSEGGSVLGIVPGMEYQESELPFGPGDRAVVFTDGVVEQQGGSAGKMLGQEPVLEVLAGSGACDEDVEGMVTLLRDHTGGDSFSDDVTIVSVEARAP